MWPLYILIGFAVLISIFIVYFSTPKGIGQVGEWQISNMLKKVLKLKNGYLINDVIIPDKENNKTSQIDHILFLNAGIFVIETKNYSGRIYGSENQREWTQVLNYGKTKNKIYNPLMQNKTHIYRLSELIQRKDNLYSCVVFKQGNIEYIDAPVYGYRSLQKYIYEILENNNISNEDLSKYYNVVLKYKENPIQTKKEHIKEIKAIKNSVENNICPRCGSNLVLRNGKNGEFFGCSNYPNCKFTKSKE
ncbi:MAG: NERD domain-containing protein [Acholeplasmatales bacterium]|nr:NERD domain-containing protein [Acholeplasmatales bacterium]